MAKFTKIERDLINQISDNNDRLKSNLAKIREAMEDLWPNDPVRIIQYYTDHGVKHSERLVGYAAELLKANSKEPLSDEEMYLLLASIYLHDIGMQCDVVNFPEIERNAEDKFGAKFNIEFKLTDGNYGIEMQKAIRRNHQYLTAAWIDYANRTGKTALGPCAKDIDPGLVDDLIDICKYHSKLPINECPAKLNYNSKGRKQLVAALLRFADELDIDQHRISIATTKNFSLDPDNSVYWWLHNRTTIGFITSNIILISIQLHPNDVKKYGHLIEEIFINNFSNKNRLVLDVLGENGILIRISSESTVKGNDRYDLLPQDIVDAIKKMKTQKETHRVSLPVNICKPMIEEYVTESQRSKDQIGSGNIRLTRIPLKPQPYFAHFFYLHANFTGRIEERKMLIDWFNSDRNPILIFVAIGGMGKSSLAWYWLKNDIDSSSLEGIFWWSFYEGEASFTKFLDDAILYSSSMEINPADTRSNYEKSRILLSLLQRHRFLFILDGFERQLGAYYDLKEESSYDEDLNDDVAQARSCVDPYFGRFLCDLISSESKTKIFITSRMKIRDLEDDTGNPFDGCRVEELKQFNPDDAFLFMEAQGVTKGTRKEILDACDVYRYHPLSLRLLSGLIVRDLQNPGDIAIAPRYDIHTDLKARRHHILEAAFNSLPEKLQKLLSEASAFRSTIAYDALSTFDDFDSDLKFEEALKDLIDWGGFLFTCILRAVFLNRL